MMPPVSYAVDGELTSPRFARAFATGCGGEVCKSDELQPGDVAMFGSPARWELLQRARCEGRRWFYGDHAYFGRRVYFRITRNALQHDCRGKGNAARLDWHRVNIRGWRADGRHILLCPNSPGYFRLFDRIAEQWVAQTISTLRQHTARDIRVRWKNDPRPLLSDLQGAWACVNFTSLCGMHAALEGIASFATEPCVSQRFGTGDLARIENPVRPDNRREMCEVLAANQWTLDEIEGGMAWETLR